MHIKKNLMVVTVLCLLMAPALDVTTMVSADAEPQLTEKALSGKTWHQTPAAHNINDVKIIKFNPKAPVGVGDWLVSVNGKKFFAAGDSPLGHQIKAHQAALKKQKAEAQKPKSSQSSQSTPQSDNNSNTSSSNSTSDNGNHQQLVKHRQDKAVKTAGISGVITAVVLFVLYGIKRLVQRNQ